MKIKTIWFEVATYERFRWHWKPTFLKSSIVYELGGQGWKAPFWEFNWLCFTFHWKGYSHKKLWKNNVLHHECPADLMQVHMNELSARINDLEAAIRKHKEEVSEELSMHVDRELWKVLDHEFRKEDDQAEIS